MSYVGVTSLAMVVRGGAVMLKAACALVTDQGDVRVEGTFVLVAGYLVIIMFFKSKHINRVTFALI